MPPLQLRQAHSCRPRETTPGPVLAPHPDAAAPNTEHARGPARRPATAGRAQGILRSRAGNNDGAGPALPPAWAHVSRGTLPPPTRTRYYFILKVTSSTTQRRFRRTKESVAGAERCSRPTARGVVPSTPASRQRPTTRRSMASSFFFSKICTRPPSPRRCQCHTTMTRPTKDFKSISSPSPQIDRGENNNNCFSGAGKAAETSGLDNVASAVLLPRRTHRRSADEHVAWLQISLIKEETRFVELLRPCRMRGGTDQTSSTVNFSCHLDGNKIRSSWWRKRSGAN